MNTFKRKSLHAAVLAGLGAVGMAGTAEAVHVNPDHLGSVLIYPYYTVRGEGASSTTASTAYYDTYVSIVNTTSSTKAVKVRILEGKRSAEVLDFNLYLSPNDVWTGAIVNTAEGAGIISVDNSCTTPRTLFPVLASGARATPTIPVATDQNHFKNFVYASGTVDGGGTSLDRTREGYLEVFEMGDVTNVTATAAAKHNLTTGIPLNCAYFDTNDLVMGAQLSPPSGGLYGAGTLINVPAGVDYSYDAVALANWSNAVNYSRAGNLTPRLTDGTVTSSTIFTAAGNVVTSFWPTSRDAVSAALTQQALLNEWVLEAGTASGTDWVVTFPTKFAYINVSAAASAAPPVGLTYPAGNPFNQNFSGGVSCDGFSFLAWNREEAPVSPPAGSVCPSPEPPAGCNPVPTFAFCYEANVLSFFGSQNLGSRNIAAVDPTAVGRNGHARVTFDQNTTTQPQHLVPLASFINNLATVPQPHRGLPVAGFMVQDFTNNNVSSVGSGFSSLYGGSYVHKYFRSIGTTP